MAAAARRRRARRVARGVVVFRRRARPPASAGPSRHHETEVDCAGGDPRTPLSARGGPPPARGGPRTRADTLFVPTIFTTHGGRARACAGADAGPPGRAHSSAAAHWYLMHDASAPGW